MDRLSTRGQLQKFMYPIKWLFYAILQFQSLTNPLQDVLEVVYGHIGKRRKRAVARVSLGQLGSPGRHTASYEDL